MNETSEHDHESPSPKNMCVTSNTNGSNNSMAELQERFELYRHIVPPLCLLALVGVLANGVVLLSARWLPRPVSGNLRLCLSLAGMDCVTCAAFISSLGYGSLWRTYKVIQAGNHSASNEQGDCVELLMECVRIGGMSSCVLHVAAIGLNQLFGTASPLTARRVLTAARVNMAIGMLWLMPLSASFGYFVYEAPGMLLGVVSEEAASFGGCSPTFMDRKSYRLSILIIFMTPILLTAACYGAIVHRMRVRHSDQILQRSVSVKRSSSSEHRRLAFTLLLIVGTITVCWTPSVFYFAFTCYVDLNLSMSANVMVNSVFMFAFIFKLSVNSAVYALRLIELRYAAWQMAAACCPKFMEHREPPRQFMQINSSLSTRASAVQSGHRKQHCTQTGQKSAKKPRDYEKTVEGEEECKPLNMHRAEGNAEHATTNL